MFFTHLPAIPTCSVRCLAALKTSSINESFTPEDCGGFNPRIKPTEQTRALAPENFKTCQPIQQPARSLGQRQFLISGRSSPFSATYSRCRCIASEYHCSASATLGASRDTRLIASSASWNRSMLLSTHISKGVVVVPSSLYPRT